VGVPVKLAIPPGALSQVVAVRLTELTLPPPPGIEDWSPVYHIEAEGLELAVPASITIPWSSNDGAVSSGLSIYASDDTSCELAPIADNYVNAGFNQGSIQRVGFAMVGAPLAAGSTCP
jgi:hypothetical protein